MEFVWDKPVLIFYKERFNEPEREAFLVVKARRLVISRVDDDMLLGNIKDFFPLMGDTDCRFGKRHV